MRDNTEAMIVANTDGAVELYFDNSKKFETTSAGAKILGDLFFDDGSNIRLGSATNGDLLIGHNGFHSTIRNLTGQLQLRSDSLTFENNDGSDFATVTGIKFGDNNKALFGNGNDLQIFHDGDNSFITDEGTGNLYIQANSFVAIRASDHNETMAKFVRDGAVELYHDNSKKFETTSSGVLVTGTITSNLAGGTAGQGLINLGSSGAPNIRGFDTGNHGSGSKIEIISGDGDDHIVCKRNGAVELFYDGTKHIYTESGGGAISGKTNLYGHNQGSNAVAVSIQFNSDNSHTGLHFAGAGQINNTYKAARFVINGSGGVYGTITYTTGGTSYSSQSSDRRSKKNIVDWTESELDKFKNLQPKLFHFDHNVDSDPKYKGYIAQDNIEAFPEAYPLIDDRYMFNPSGMVHYLMKAVKELSEKNDALEARIKTLEG
tara:strand:- start:98 stop:1393 length:1296 start_codon:yes stop_codon:yes gene_type:complete